MEVSDFHLSINLIFLDKIKIKTNVINFMWNWCSYKISFLWLLHLEHKSEHGLRHCRDLFWQMEMCDISVLGTFFLWKISVISVTSQWEIMLLRRMNGCLRYVHVLTFECFPKTPAYKTKIDTLLLLYVASVMDSDWLLRCFLKFFTGDKLENQDKSTQEILDSKEIFFFKCSN